MPLSHDARVASDAEFLGLQQIDGHEHLRFNVEAHLARMDGKLYGGTAVAVSVAAAEQLSARNALWMTTQFVATAPENAEVDVDVEVLAGGRRTNQVRVTGKVDGEVMFASLGATGHHTEGGLSGEFENRPVVSRPEDSEAGVSPFASMREMMRERLEEQGIELPEMPMEPPRDSGFNRAIEMRPAEIIEHPDDGPGRTCMWVRRQDSAPITPAVAAFMADMVPMSIGRAAGEMGGGISLDNSIRIGSFVETEWLLLDLRPHLAVGDYGHGLAHLWSEDGHLMGTASQTAAMFRFDPSNLPWAKKD